MVRLLITSCLILSAIRALAIIANPEPATIFQPDGTSLEITLHGDEFMSLTTTIDGFSLVRDADGFMKYAMVEGDMLVSSLVIAHDPEFRTSGERNFLKSIDRFAMPESFQASARVKRLTAMPAQSVTPGQAAFAPVYNYDLFRGLVILVEFNDCKFSRPDITQIFTDMICKENYDGFGSSTGEKIEYTGSVRDYFYSNSMGRFNPRFDVIGPVTVDYSQTYPCASENSRVIIPAVLAAADSLVNYSDYDTDGDNVVDMVYFIFAGAGSNYAGNDSRYLWPHAAQVASSMSLDGVKFKRYACSTEFYGQEKDRMIDGIGTICHEFSHVLGLPDLYDTDYSTNGLSTSPEDWSVMAGGSYLNFARTPCCFSLYERYAIGFASPETITEEGDYSLQTIGGSNKGYRINSAIANEYFLLENRQNIGWDQYLPGHGLVVFRVDSTDVDIWVKNKVNAYANRNYYEMLRANPFYNDKGSVVDSSGDPFPGSGNVTELDNVTTPSLRSWTGLETPVVLSGIKEFADGQIVFHARKDVPDASLEDFENCPLTDGSDADITGSFCQWSLADGAQIVLSDNLNEGKQAVAMKMGASLTSGVVDRDVDFISVDIFNPTNYQTTMSCQYSSDNGASWQYLSTIGGDSQVKLVSKSQNSVIFKAKTNGKCRYRFTEDIGNKTSYIDNINFMFTKKLSSGVDDIAISNGNDLRIQLEGAELSVAGDSDEVVNVYTIEGRLVATMRPVAGRGCVILPEHGLYIVRQASKAFKVLY